LRYAPACCVAHILSLPRSPRPLSWIKGATYKERGGECWGSEEYASLAAVGGWTSLFPGDEIVQCSRIYDRAVTGRVGVHVGLS